MERNAICCGGLESNEIVAVSKSSVLALIKALSFLVRLVCKGGRFQFVKRQ
jgi:hypothetical protein